MRKGGVATELAATPSAPPTGKPLNLCRTCGHDFGGVHALDMHRVGKHEHLYSDERLDGRRCLTETEMLARGMYLSAHGRWSQPRNGLSERLGLGIEATHEPTPTI